MSDLDLSFFLEPPDLDTTAVLEIEALSPLSMSTAQPGTYYRSQPAPTEAMLYGMLENALGWHFPEEVRRDILEQLRETAKNQLEDDNPLIQEPWITGEEDSESGSGFVSLLQHHLEFETAFIPEAMHFDDLWSRHLTRSDSFMGGSRNNDYRIEALVNAKKGGRASFEKKSESDILNPEEALDPAQDERVLFRMAARLWWSIQFGVSRSETIAVFEGALKPFFPTYYVKPTPREYVIPAGSYRYRVNMTSSVFSLVKSALEDPEAPLYLGTNDGWVEANLEVIT